MALIKPIDIDAKCGDVHIYPYVIFIPKGTLVWFDGDGPDMYWFLDGVEHRVWFRGIDKDFIDRVYEELSKGGFKIVVDSDEIAFTKI